jgi:hypothetical protein
MPRVESYPEGFDPKKPLVVRKALNVNGRHFKPGDPFPHHKFKVPTRRLAQMFDLNQLCHPSEAETPIVEAILNAEPDIEAPEDLALQPSNMDGETDTENSQKEVEGESSDDRPDERE